MVCPAISSDNQHVYVTFGGGGLFVVDMTTEPMSIVAEYTDDVISAAGCGGREAGGSMYLNAGVSASGAGADDSTFIMLPSAAGLSRWCTTRTPCPIRRPW